MMIYQLKYVDFLTKKINLMEGGMLTEFGKFLRRLRIDCEELLKDMADKLGVTSSYLSAVETSKRNIPDDWVEKISNLYKLDTFDREALQNTADNSVKTITMNISKMPKKKKETAILFARRFEEVIVDDSAIEAIRKILNK